MKKRSHRPGAMPLATRAVGWLCCRAGSAWLPAALLPATIGARTLVRFRVAGWRIPDLCDAPVCAHREADSSPAHYPQLDPVFANPKGIASHSPGLPSLRGYPGSQATTFSTLKGLRLLAASDVASFLHARTKTQPRWGCDRNKHPSRVVAWLQPWALRRNPFGIQEFPHPEMWNDKAFRLDAMKSFAIGWASDYWLFAAGQFKCRCRNWYVPLPLIVCGPLKNSMSVRSSIPSLA